MKKIIMIIIVSATFSVTACYADDARQIYQAMKGLEGDWVLSPADAQEGKSTKHALVAPLVGTDEIGMSFKLIGRGSTVQESLLPGTQKEMVSMYHCKDASCSQVKATHYCVKQNQPEMLADFSSTANRLVYKCDMSTQLCQSGQDHVHKITHELSGGGTHLKTTYTSWKDGEYLKDSVYHFDHK
jgi:hypothetical protein